MAGAACDPPTSITRADVCCALYLLHCTYHNVVHGVPQPHEHTPRGMAAFRIGLTPPPLLPGEVFPAIGPAEGGAGAHVQCPDVSACSGSGGGGRAGLAGAAGCGDRGALEAGGEAWHMPEYMRRLPWRQNGADSSAQHPAPAATPRRLLLLRVSPGHPTAQLQTHLAAQPGSSSEEVHVVDLASSRLAVTTAMADVNDSDSVLASAMDGSSILPAALVDALHAVTLGPSALLVVLDWGLSPAEVDVVARHVGVLPEHRHVADMPSLPLSYLCVRELGPFLLADSSAKLGCCSL